MNPLQSNLHVNAPLTNFLVAQLQDPSVFVADRVFPRVPVSKQSDLYWTLPNGQFLKGVDPEKIKRAPGTETQGIEWNQSSDAYYCHVYGLHADIHEQVMANADSPWALETTNVMMLDHSLRIMRERQWADKYFKAGQWAVDWNGVAGTPGAGQMKHWSDQASTPIEDIRKATTEFILRSGGIAPNAMLLDRRVHDALIDHADVVDRVKYGQSSKSQATIDTSDLASLFKIPTIEIMQAVNNTAKDGLADSLAFISGKHALLYYKPPAPGLMVPMSGATFVWSGLYGSDVGGRVKRFPITERAIEARIEVELAYDFKMIGAALGTFFNGIVA